MEFEVRQYLKAEINRRKRAVVKGYDRICAHRLCQHPFPVEHPHQRYCSPGCKYDEKMLRAREARQNGRA